MSLLSSFLSSHLIPALETALAAHEPDIQAAILGELQDFSGQVGDWMTNKLNAVNAPVAVPVAPVVS